MYRKKEDLSNGQDEEESGQIDEDDADTGTIDEQHRQTQCERLQRSADERVDPEDAAAMCRREDLLEPGALVNAPTGVSESEEEERAQCGDRMDEDAQGEEAEGIEDLAADSHLDLLPSRPDARRQEAPRQDAAERQALEEPVAFRSHIDCR